MKNSIQQQFDILMLACAANISKIEAMCLVKGFKYKLEGAKASSINEEEVTKAATSIKNRRKAVSLLDKERKRRERVRRRLRRLTNKGATLAPLFVFPTGNTADVGVAPRRCRPGSVFTLIKAEVALMKAIGASSLREAKEMPVDEVASKGWGFLALANRVAKAALKVEGALI